MALRCSRLDTRTHLVRTPGRKRTDSDARSDGRSLAPRLAMPTPRSIKFHHPRPHRRAESTRPCENRNKPRLSQAWTRWIQVFPPCISICIAAARLRVLKWEGMSQYLVQTTVVAIQTISFKPFECYQAKVSRFCGGPLSFTSEY